MGFGHCPMIDSVGGFVQYGGKRKAIWLTVFHYNLELKSFQTVPVLAGLTSPHRYHSLHWFGWLYESCLQVYAPSLTIYMLYHRSNLGCWGRTITTTKKLIHFPRTREYLTRLIESVPLGDAESKGLVLLLYKASGWSCFISFSQKNSFP